jgi:hypothetical protein
MDHAANDVLKPVVIFNSTPAIRQFLSLVLRAKGRAVSDNHRDLLLPETTQPAIIDHGLPVRGLHNILAYLEDQYPDPPLCFNTPTRRAVVRMAVDQIIDDLYVDEPDTQHPTLLAVASALHHQCFVMDRLSMLDLALVPVSPPGFIWDRHRRDVMRAIE